MIGLGQMDRGAGCGRGGLAGALALEWPKSALRENHGALRDDRVEHASAEGTVAAIYAALDQVVDPELDESVVQLGFIGSVDLSVHGQATIHLRLPTFWCSPSFAYLMADDARRAALQVPGVRSVQLELADHAHSDEISQGVSDGQAFEAIFPDEADDNLDELRALFRAKAFGMRQEQLVRFLLDAGLSPAEIVALRVADVLDTSDRSGLRLRSGGVERLVRGGAPLARMYLDRRRRLGLDRLDWLITDEQGARIAAEDLREHLQRTRRQRVSMTFNAEMCRGLLETRYGLHTTHKEEAR